MSRAVAVIWGGMLAVTCVGVVPVVIALLQRTLNAARRIERYTAEMLEGGVGIAGNTAKVAALKDTISAAPQLIDAAGSLQSHTASIEQALATKALSNGHVEQQGEAATQEEKGQEEEGV